MGSAASLIQRSISHSVNRNKLQGQPTAESSVRRRCQYLFSLWNGRYLGWILWVWSGGVPGLPGFADHRGPDARALRQGPHRGLALPAGAVGPAASGQAWVQRRAGPGTAAPFHLKCAAWLKSAENTTVCSRLSTNSDCFLSAPCLNEYVIQYCANNRSVLKMRDH